MFFLEITASIEKWICTCTGWRRISATAPCCSKKTNKNLEPITHVWGKGSLIEDQIKSINSESDSAWSEDSNILFLLTLLSMAFGIKGQIEFNTVTLVRLDFLYLKIHLFIQNFTSQQDVCLHCTFHACLPQILIRKMGTCKTIPQAFLH